ncbi:MAG TPA: hypothetical protein VK139_05685 [Microbacteriaceae bacterium]|nr:hypothetical protein [Microbacteriaceae bacterium]
MRLSECDPTLSSQGIEFQGYGYRSVGVASDSGTTVIADSILGRHLTIAEGFSQATEIPSKKSPFNLVQTAPDGSVGYFATSGLASIIGYSTSHGRLAKVFTTGKAVDGMDISDSGKTLMYWSGEANQIGLIDTESGEARGVKFDPESVLLELPEHHRITRAVLADSDSKVVFTVSGSDHILYYDIKRKLFSDTELRAANVTGLSARGSVLAVTDGQAVAIAKAPQAIGTPWHSERLVTIAAGRVEALDVDPSGSKVFAATSGTNALHVLDIADPKFDSMTKLPSAPSALGAISNGGKVWVVYGQSANIDQYGPTAEHGAGVPYQEIAHVQVRASAPLNIYRELAAMASLERCATNKDFSNCVLRAGTPEEGDGQPVCKASMWVPGTQPVGFGNFNYTVRKSKSILTGTTSMTTDDFKYGFDGGVVTQKGREIDRTWNAVFSHFQLSVHGDWGHSWSYINSASRHLGNVQEWSESYTYPFAQALPGQLAWIVEKPHISTFRDSYMVFNPGQNNEFVYPLPPYAIVNMNRVPEVQIGASANPGEDNPCWTEKKLREFYKQRHIFLDPNGAEGATPAPLTYNGLNRNQPAIVLPDEDHLYREGYKFLWWNAKPDGSGRIYPVGQHVRPEEDMTLYAIWAKLPSGTQPVPPPAKPEPPTRRLGGTGTSSPSLQAAWNQLNELNQRKAAAGGATGLKNVGGSDDADAPRSQVMDEPGTAQQRPGHVESGEQEDGAPDSAIPDEPAASQLPGIQHEAAVEGSHVAVNIPAGPEQAGVEVRGGGVRGDRDPIPQPED